jgi:uncharacterized protein (DUF58 family)
MTFRATRTGAWVAAGAVVVVAAGLAVGYPALTMLGVAGVVAVAIALLWLVRRPPLSVHRQIAPERVPRGDPAFGLVELQNAGRLPIAPLLARERIGDETVEVPLAGVRPGQLRQTTYRLPTARRGAYLVGPLEVIQTDPLALFERRRSLDEPEHLWVHPRTHPLRLPPTGRAPDLEGLDTSEILEGGMNFHELREYIPGDDLRRVHWRTTARAGTLMVRTHVDARRPEVLVLVDDRASSYSSPELFEETVDFAASAAAASVTAAYPTRLQLVSGAALGDEVTGAVATTDLTSVLDALSNVALAPVVDPAVGLVAQAGIERLGGSWAVVATGEGGMAELDQVAALRPRFATVVAACASGTDPGRAILSGINLLRGLTAFDLATLWNL